MGDPGKKAEGGQSEGMNRKAGPRPEADEHRGEDAVEQQSAGKRRPQPAGRQDEDSRGQEGGRRDEGSQPFEAA